MTGLPGGVEQAFRVAAAELGMYGAARLVLRELCAQGGAPLVDEARASLGGSYPVLDFVASRWAAGEDRRPIEVDPLLGALRGVTRLLVVGLEAEHLDALAPRLGGVEVGLLTESMGLETDWRRVLANYGGTLRPASLAELSLWAGSRSALLTFVYGVNGQAVNVPPAWLRVLGPDVRTQYRELIGWDILGAPMEVYPRWLVEASTEGFSRLLSSRAP